MCKCRLAAVQLFSQSIPYRSHQEKRRWGKMFSKMKEEDKGEKGEEKGEEKEDKGQLTDELEVPREVAEEVRGSPTVRNPGLQCVVCSSFFLNGIL